MVEQDNLNLRCIKIEVDVKIGAIIKESTRVDIGQTRDKPAGIEDSLGKTEVDTDLSKVIEEIISEIPEDTMDKIAEKSIGIIVIGMMAITEAGISLEKDHFQEIMAILELKVQVIVDRGQDPELVSIGIG